LAGSLASAWTLCRALVRLNDAGERLAKADAARRMAAPAGISPDLIERLEMFRQAPAPAQAAALFSPYLELVEKLLHYARQDNQKEAL